MQNGTLYNFLKYATLNIVYDFLKKLLLSVDKNAITWFFFYVVCFVFVHSVVLICSRLYFWFLVLTAYLPTSEHENSVGIKRKKKFFTY